MSQCPVCAQLTEDISTHILEAHPLFLLVLQSFYLPSLQVPYHEYDYDTNYEHEHEETYEDLLALCESMGNVDIGVPDIDTVTVAIVSDSTGEPCPICLESEPECPYSRKIIKCNHRFCGTCIETWLESHKTCPICKVELSDA